MTPETIPELIAWTAGVGSAALAAGALLIGPSVERWRRARLARRLQREWAAMQAQQRSTPLPELIDLLREVQGTGVPMGEGIEAAPDGSWHTLSSE